MSELTSPLAQTVSVPDGVFYREIEGEAVLLEIETGKYFGLDEVGTRMWTLLQRHGTLRAAYEALLDEFEVPEERLQRDLLELVDRLVAQKLLERHDP